MTDRQHIILDKLVKAYEFGFITHIQDARDCKGGCDNCPAKGTHLDITEPIVKAYNEIVTKINK